MVPQQVSAQEMQLLQEFHESPPPRHRAHTGFTALCIGLALSLGLTACAPSSDTPRLNRKTLAQANAILEDISRSELAMSPELASRLGAEQDKTGTTSARLDDHSQAGFERQRLVRIDLLGELERRPLLPPDQPVAKDLVVLADAYARLVRLQQIGHGRLTLADARPYALDPFSGIWIEGPQLIANDHRIDTLDDAEAYVARLQALPDAIDDTRRRLLADAEAGLTPPPALLHQTRTQLAALMADNGTGLAPLEQTLRNLTQSLPDVSRSDFEALMAAADQAVQSDLMAAYLRLDETLEALVVEAPAQAGLWAQTNGHETYLALIDWQIENHQTLDDLHQDNIDAVLARTSALQRALDAANVAPGPLNQRLAEFLVPPEDALAGIDEPSAPPVLTGPTYQARAFATPPLSGLRALPARLDATRPASLVLTRPQLTKWPAHLHNALKLEADISLRAPYATLMGQRRTAARALATYPAIRAAWRLYSAERIAVSALTTPQEQIGFHQLALMRAAMAAADTGLHHQRWTLERTTAYLTETTGLPEALMYEASLRLAAQPGEAAARMLAYRKLSALQERASRVLGPRYDEIGFQSVLLGDGPRPFALIEHDVEAWYEARLGSPS